MTRDTNIAVNMLARMPIIRVTENPLMGPVPNWNRKMAAITVVMLASIMVRTAFLNPESMALRGDFPLAVLL